MSWSETVRRTELLVYYSAAFLFVYWNGISQHCSCIWLMPHSLTLPHVSVETAQERSKKMNVNENCVGCGQYCPKEAINVGKLTVKRERYHNSNITANDLMESRITVK